MPFASGASVTPDGSAMRVWELESAGRVNDKSDVVGALVDSRRYATVAPFPDDTNPRNRRLPSVAAVTARAGAASR